MCRPVSGSRKEACPGGHIGPPLRNDWRYSGSTGNRCETEPFQRGGTEPAPYRRVEADQRRGEVTLPYGCNAGGAQQRADVPKAWLPPAKFRAEIWGVSHRHRPLRPAGDGTPGSSCPTDGCGEPPRLPWVAAHSGASAARVRIAAEIIPKGVINAGQSLSQPAADSSLYTREPLGTGDADCRVGPLGLLAMTMVSCHSEERSDVGIRSFLRCTGVRAAEVVGPYGRSTEVPATGRCRHRPLRKGEKAVSTTRGSAPSAERAAGQI